VKETFEGKGHKSMEKLWNIYLSGRKPVAF